MTVLIETTDQILLMAFRYALPRNTGAPAQVVVSLRQYWSVLPPWMREQIHRDIRDQKRRSTIGEHNDYSTDWDKVLEWEV